MRVGILASSFPAALKIYNEVRAVEGCQFYILLCRTPSDGRLRSLFKHVARFVIGDGRVLALRLLAGGRVRLFQQPLDDPRSLARLKSLRLDTGLHKLGVIYRDATIKAFRLGILNPHIGLLPRYRGRSVMEWALLEGGSVGITVFFIDSGIDTGERIVLREGVDITRCPSIESAKAYLFSLDAVFFRRALELLRSDSFSFERNDTSAGRRYYVMSHLFQNVSDELLKASG